MSNLKHNNTEYLYEIHKKIKKIKKSVDELDNLRYNKHCQVHFTRTKK